RRASPTVRHAEGNHAPHGAEPVLAGAGAGTTSRRAEPGRAPSPAGGVRTQRLHGRRRTRNRGPAEAQRRTAVAVRPAVRPTGQWAGFGRTGFRRRIARCVLGAATLSCAVRACLRRLFLPRRLLL